MATRSIHVVVTIAALSVLIHTPLIAQVQRDIIPLKPWASPLYWQPTRVESQGLAKADTKPDMLNVLSSDATALAATPAGSLVFVAMTPCRVVDTRPMMGFTGAFGPPGLIGGGTRTFPVQSSTPPFGCSIPSIAQAYSFNVTIVPPGFVNWVTVWPTGQAQPNASTLNGYGGTVIANAAIVPAGTSGSVDVFASNNTDLIIDINGYYAPQSGITLAQGNAAAPSLSFAGDPGTGIFSAGAGTLNLTTAGTSRLGVASNGNVGIGTLAPLAKLDVRGDVFVGLTAVPDNNSSPGNNIYVADDGGGDPHNSFRIDSYIDNFYLVARSGAGSNAGTGIVFRTAPPHGGEIDRVTISQDGNVGIGTTSPEGKLHVEGPPGITAVFGNGRGVSSPGVFGRSDIGTGVYGTSSSGKGVEGQGDGGATGVLGQSVSGTGVFGESNTGYAGYFSGRVYATGTITQLSDARLKQDVASLGYGLREVLRLRPVTFNWKDKPGTGRQLGLIAQEVETVLPELVPTDKDAEHTKGLNYIGLVPVTIKAIQEQQAGIEDQQKHISELEARLAALEALLSVKAQSTAGDQ